MTGEEIYKINVQIRSISDLGLFELPQSGVASEQETLTDSVEKRSASNVLPSSSGDSESKYSTQPLTVLISQCPFNAVIFQGLISAIYFLTSLPGILLRHFKI